jgi:hypothetical protein
MSSSTEYFPQDQAQEAAPQNGVAGIVTGFALVLLIGTVWISFLFGVVQPWIEGGY